MGSSLQQGKGLPTRIGRLSRSQGSAKLAALLFEQAAVDLYVTTETPVFDSQVIHSEHFLRLDAAVE